MSNHANSRRKIEMPKRIKSKFVAALCMLLVSAIMLISSTYAWFTLSTAPEIRGITTNVGANGNLEIALLNKTSYASTADDLGIISQIGDSMTVKNVEEANETWGNLVDLASAKYGLNHMVLAPARLNFLDAAGKSLLPNILRVPSYGSDGRVIEVKTDTYTANWADNTFKYADDAAGVRAIGTTSGITVRISAYRNALAYANSNMTNARTLANQSLSTHAQDLATLMVARAQDANTSVDPKYIDIFEDILAKAEAANENVIAAIRQAALAYELSANNAAELTDEQVNTLVTNAATTVVAADFATDAQALYTQTKTNIDAAKVALEALKGRDSYTFSEIQGVLNYIVDINKVTVSGKGLSDGKDAVLNAAIDEFTSTQSISIVFGAGSGVYSDIAKQCEPYIVSTNVLISYGSFTDVSARATIKADATTPYYIPEAVSQARNGGTPPENVGGGSAATLSDIYGYALDFGFRTNAAASNLLLQTAAAQRVYNNNENPSSSDLTQGAGSYMELRSMNDNFGVDDVRALMSAIRVAFVDGNNVLAIGALDIESSMTGGKVTYTGGTATADGKGLKAELYLYDYTVAATDNADGFKLTLGAKKADNVISALTQNVAKKVSVIVYLDGDIVDNSMVANANRSLTGALNLQFASSAALVPMENSALRNAATLNDGSYTEVTAGDANYDKLVAQYGVALPENMKIYSKDGVYYYSMDSGKTLKKITIPA